MWGLLQALTMSTKEGAMFKGSCLAQSTHRWKQRVSEDTDALEVLIRKSLGEASAGLGLEVCVLVEALGSPRACRATYRPSAPRFRPAVLIMSASSLHSLHTVTSLSPSPGPFYFLLLLLAPLAVLRKSMGWVPLATPFLKPPRLLAGFPLLLPWPQPP